MGSSDCKHITIHLTYVPPGYALYVSVFVFVYNQYTYFLRKGVAKNEQHADTRCRVVICMFEVIIFLHVSYPTGG